MLSALLIFAILAPPFQAMSPGSLQRKSFGTNAKSRNRALKDMVAHLGRDSIPVAAAESSVAPSPAGPGGWSVSEEAFTVFRQLITPWLGNPPESLPAGPQVSSLLSNLGKARHCYL